MNSLPILEKAVGAITLLSEEKQNAEYEGFLCQVNESQQLIRSRLAKKTPKKEGYFVAFWEKNQQNQNEAFDATEAPEMLAIVIADQEKQGLFLLPKECLIQQKGKMAARFYPSWCQNLNQTAKKTQKWQLTYFTDLSKY